MDNDLKEKITPLVGLWLLDAMLVEVPQLEENQSKMALGRPRKDRRTHLVRRVVHDIDDLIYTCETSKKKHEVNISIVKVLLWLMPSMRNLSERTMIDMVQAARKHNTGDSVIWLSETEKSFLDETDFKRIKCAKCGHEEDFKGKNKAANNAAREAGWFIDTRKSALYRYYCVKCAEKKGKTPCSKSKT